MFKIQQNEDRVTLLSARRMPHMSVKGPMDAARSALREAIQVIDAPPGQIIDGVYSSQVEGFFDVENVLFYNVETATFKNAARNGLRARRCRLHSEDDCLGFPHKMDYRLIAVPQAPASCQVQVTFTPGRLTNIFNVWWSAGNGEVIRRGEITGAYGIFVELGGPTRAENPAGKMKMLFDGIIASLQQDTLPDAVAVERLSREHGIAAAAIEDRLRSPIAPVIPASRSTKLVRPFRSGVQWHPADDRCEECTLIVTQRPAPVCNAYVYSL